MKEQDIRRILSDVCGSLDARRAQLGPLAAGVTMAMLLNCCSPAVCSYGSPGSDTATTNLSDTGPDVTSDTPAMHYAAPFDSAVSETITAPPVDAYGVPFDALPPFDSGAADSADGDATDGDGDVPVDTGAAMRYAVLFDSQTAPNQGG